MTADVPLVWPIKKSKYDPLFRLDMRLPIHEADTLAKRGADRPRMQSEALILTETSKLCGSNTYPFRGHCR